jgi:hypothetical protein
MCESISGYLCTSEVYTGAKPADTDFNRAFHVIDSVLSGKEQGPHHLHGQVVLII